MEKTEACTCDDPLSDLVSCDGCNKEVCAWCRYDMKDSSRTWVMTSCKDCLLAVATGVPIAFAPPDGCGAGYFAASEKKQTEETEKEYRDAGMLDDEYW